MNIKIPKFKDIHSKISTLKEKKHPMAFMLIGLFVLFCIVLTIHLWKDYKMKEYLHEQSEEAVTVSTFKVKYEEWTSELKSFGSLRAVLGIVLTTEVGGIVENVYFHDGQQVNKDNVLVQLLADADIALLKSLEAEAKLAEVTYERDKAQYAINVVSKETLDMDLYTMQNQQELLVQQAAMVKKKSISAPFDGKLGVSLINPGVYLNPGDPIVSLQNLSTLYIDFYLPEKYIAKLKKDQKITFITDAYPNRTFVGKINALEPIVDPDSRNIHVEGIIDNPLGELLPGMYVTVNVTTGDPVRRLTIPQAAISYNPYGDLVYVVTKKIKSKNKADEEDADEDEINNPNTKNLYVEQRFVKLGELRGDQVVILSGLKEGEEIVTGGQLKLKNHSRVIINNQVVPTNDAKPVVEDEQTI